jgi:putative ABC transport system permease protein
MKFTQKVTARNIFRYKNRMFMTIFGVAGAASILFAGFSMQYSISERLATILNVKQGDTITYTDSNEKTRKVKVSGICKMYAGHFIFMNQTEYKNIYEEQIKSNAKLLLFKDSSIENTQKESAKFMELSAVEGVVQNTTLYNQINTIVKSLNRIMIVLIVLAVLLAIVILYNLTNINVAERIREIY